MNKLRFYAEVCYNNAMTLRARRITAASIIVLNLLLCLGAAGVLIRLLASAAFPHSWTDLRQAYPGLGYILLQSTAGCIALITLYRFFRKSSIPEVFLLMAAVGTIAFENLRIVYILLEIFQQPMIYFEFVSRILVFFQIAGMSGLFFVSLYILGIQYQKVDTILWTQAVIGLLFAYALPIRTTAELSFSGHPVGGPYLYSVLIGGIAGLGLINLICSWLQQRTVENWGLYVGTAALCIGRLLSIVLPNDYRALGMLILVTGIILFSRDQYSRYLWN